VEDLTEGERESQGGNLLFPFIEHFDDILREREREREREEETKVVMLRYFFIDHFDYILTTF
jgi:hypothetical protein